MRLGYTTVSPGPRPDPLCQHENGGGNVAQNARGCRSTSFSCHRCGTYWSYVQHAEGCGGKCQMKETQY